MEFKAGITFKWSSNVFNEEIIPKQFFYDQNNFPAVKTRGFDTSIMIPAKFDNYSLAFKNSDQYFFIDIPSDYQGLPSFKFETRYQKDNLTFKINSPTYICFGLMTHYPNPLPEYFEDTQDLLQVVAVKPDQKPVKGKLKAYGSGLMRIYKKLYNAGTVNIPLKKIGANLRGIPMTVFFAPDDTGASPLSCGGKEEHISNPISRFYDKCKASSTIRSDLSCTNGLTKTEWVSKGEGVNAWMQVIFKGLFIITKFDFYQRQNPAERAKTILLEFSDGSTQSFPILNTDGKQTFNPKKVQTSYVIARIKEVYGTINNGGRFDFFGYQCKNLKVNESKEANGLLKAADASPKEIPALFTEKKEKVIGVGCKDTLINTRKFRGIEMNEGNTLLIKCYSSCSLSPFLIYGNEKYTKDSAICKAAFHSKKLSAAGGKVRMKFSKGLRQYEEAVSNGIRSLSKNFSQLSYSFELVEEKDDIIIKEGTKIDVLSPYKNNFLPGTIKEVIDAVEGKTLTILIEDSPLKAFQLHYPDKSKIVPCGEKLGNRNCSGSRRTVNKNKPVMIRFVSSQYKPSGNYLPDFGGLYGSTGKPFGWSKNIENRVKFYPGRSPNNNMLETLIHFPPSAISRYCRKEKKDTICDKVDFTVKAGEGKFNVKLFVGDINVNSKIDFSINGKSVFSGIVKKGELKVIQKVIEARNQFITITSECTKDCDFAMAKLNGVEISPAVSAAPKVKEEDSKVEIEKCGGSLEKG